MIRDPFKVMIAIALIAIIGFVSIIGIFVSKYPVFNPFAYRPKVDEYTYISPHNFTMKNGQRIVDIFQFTGPGSQSIVFFSVQVIDVKSKGSIYMRFNNIDLGNNYVETPGIIESRIASCCFVTLVNIEVDNVIEFESHGFEGSFRYIIVVPLRGNGL